MSRTKFVALAWAFVSVAGVTAAVATPPKGNVSRNELINGKISDALDVKRADPSDFHIQDVTFDPGSSTGWHTHPGPEFAIVKAGELVLERAPACQPITLKAGEGAFIPAGTPHLAHNDGKDPAEIYSTQIMPAGTTVLRQEADEQCGAKTAPPAKN